MDTIPTKNEPTRLGTHYRLVVMDDDTFEEVVTLKLSRTSVYIGLSTLFVFLIGITIVFIAFTPLKYYIPGVGIVTGKQIGRAHV